MGESSRGINHTCASNFWHDQLSRLVFPISENVSRLLNCVYLPLIDADFQLADDFLSPEEEICRDLLVI
jgi:hypothetical protein